MISGLMTTIAQHLCWLADSKVTLPQGGVDDKASASMTLRKGYDAIV